MLAASLKYGNVRDVLMQPEPPLTRWACWARPFTAASQRDAEIEAIPGSPRHAAAAVGLQLRAPLPLRRPGVHSLGIPCRPPSPPVAKPAASRQGT